MKRDEAREWAYSEFGRAELGDARRTGRLVSMAAAAARRPGGKVLDVFRSSAERQGAYDARGMKVVHAYALGSDGTPLGIVDQQWWARSERRHPVKPCPLIRWRRRPYRLWLHAVTPARAPRSARRRAGGDLDGCWTKAPPAPAGGRDRRDRLRHINWCPASLAIVNPTHATVASTTSTRSPSATGVRRSTGSIHLHGRGEVVVYVIVARGDVIAGGSWSAVASAGLEATAASRAACTEGCNCPSESSS
jgi:Transposase DNA-binding